MLYLSGTGAVEPNIMDSELETERAAKKMKQDTSVDDTPSPLSGEPDGSKATTVSTALVRIIDGHALCV